MQPDFDALIFQTGSVFTPGAPTQAIVDFIRTATVARG